MTLRGAHSAEIPERRLDAADARAYLDAPVTEAERDEVRTLVQWFTRRYPTPAERLAYARRAYARWQRTLRMIAKS